MLSFAERVFEDHEHLVEELSTWTLHSENKVLFLLRPYRYLMFKEPQVSRHLAFVVHAESRLAETTSVTAV